MFICQGYAANSADTPLEPFSFERREPGPTDVSIEILFCGVCHSDLHVARNEWGKTTYPCVPGHEIVGKVVSVGNAVTKFKPGDLAGVGCLVDSDRTCKHCRMGLETYCESGFVATYNGKDRLDGKQTFGGYSSHIVVDEQFTLRIPENLPLAGVAPLLCAGITNYSALRHWKVGAGDMVGVIGLGGLGHVAVKIARAMGAKVIVFTSSANKVEDALALGASSVVVTRDRSALEAWRNKLNLILDTVAADHDVNPYLDLLDLDGTYVLVGIPENPLSVHPFSVIARRRVFTGARMGGLRETQEMLDFCAQHGITADIELISIADVNTAYERMARNDVKYRFVIDMATLPRGT